MILKVQDYSRGASQRDAKRKKSSREKRPGGTNLLVSELDQTRLVLDNLVPFSLAPVEQLGQSKPLPRHLVPIVRVDKLIVVHAIRCIPPHLLDGRFAAVEVEDVVNESLALLREGEGLGRVRGVVFGRVGLARLVVFTRGGRGQGSGFHFAVR